MEKRNIFKHENINCMLANETSSKFIAWAIKNESSKSYTTHSNTVCVCSKCCIPSKDHTREPVRACFLSRGLKIRISKDDHKHRVDECAREHVYPFHYFKQLNRKNFHLKHHFAPGLILISYFIWFGALIQLVSSVLFLLLLFILFV